MPQGSQLAPVLSNLYLDPFDRQLAQSKRRFVRYADDLVCFAASADEAGETLNQCTAALAEVELQPNIAKTRIYRVDQGFLFLGFVFNRDNHVASPAARATLKLKLGGGAYDDEDTGEWSVRRSAISRGWKNYYESGTSNNRRKCHSTNFKLTRRKPAVHAYTDLTSEDESIFGASDSKRYIEAEQETEVTSSPVADVVKLSASVSVAERLRELSNRASVLLAGHGANELAREVRQLLNTDGVQSLEAEQREGMRLLARSYCALGLHGAAWRCLREAGDSPAEATAKIGRDKVAPVPFGTRDVETWLEIFGKKPVHIQFLDRLGRSGYRPYSAALSASDLKAHWEGKLTLSVSVYEAQDRVQFGLLDLDITRQILDRIDKTKREALRLRLLDDARGLLERAHRAGVDGVIEDSCLKGYHLWFFFRTPLMASHVRAFLAALCSACGQPPEGTHRELFPSSDTCPPDGLNSRMRLPLGIHRVTGARSRFLAPDGTPCAIGSEIPGVLSTLTGRRISDATQLLTVNIVPFDTSARHTARDSASAPARSQGVGGPESCSALTQVTSGCGVFRALQAKAQQEHHLTHAERVVLRGILVPLGDVGLNALHGIIAHCSNYSRPTTAKYASVPNSSPIGCARIREALGEFADLAGCTCSFKPRKNSYPNPLRHIKIRSEPTQDQPVTEQTVSSEPAPDQPETGQITSPEPSANVKLALPDTSVDPVKLLAAYRDARQTLLACQRQLLAITGGCESIDTPVGRLHLAGADAEILKWRIELG